MRPFLLCAFCVFVVSFCVSGCSGLTPLDQAAQDEAAARAEFDEWLRTVAAAAHSAAADTAGSVPELPSARQAEKLTGAVSEAVGRPERETPWPEVTPADLSELQLARDELKRAAAALATARAAARDDAAAAAKELDRLRGENKMLHGQVGLLVAVVRWIWRGLFAVPVLLVGMAGYQLFVRRLWNARMGLLMGGAYLGLAAVLAWLWWQYGQMVIVVGMLVLIAAALAAVILLLANKAGFETLVAKIQAWRDQADPQIRASFDVFMDSAAGQSTWLRSMVRKAKSALGLASAGT